MCKKIIAVLTCVVSVLSLCACGGNKTEEPVDATSLAENTAASADTQAATDVIQHTVDASSQGTDVTEEQTTEQIAAEMTKAQIIELYKTAAIRSDANVKSQQEILLKNISINNGQYEKAMNIVTPIMAKLLANNSTDKDGVTGGYTKLNEADVKSAKLYYVGDNTVIELVLNNQVSGAREDALSGSVGHGITAVGDIGVVTDQFKDLGLPMELSDENTSIHYTNATVKVVIDKNANIVNGTWKYTVDIRLEDYKVFGKPVESTSVLMDNVITVNGGFAK